MLGFERHPRLRVFALILCSVGVSVRGVAYIGQTSTGGLTTFVDALVPLQVWAGVWIGAGLLILAGIWHRIVARWALNAGASLWMLWALSYMWAWVVGDQPRGWVTGSALGLIAGLMWIVAALADTVGPAPRIRVPYRRKG